MSESTSEMETADHRPRSPSNATGKPERTKKKPARVLACILCQQRKVKCDRKFPCDRCMKAGVNCVSASAVHKPRRRRFPERELLDRLRQYETLLRDNHIAFEPLHGSNYPRTSHDENDGASECAADIRLSSPDASTTSKSGLLPLDNKLSLWDAMNQRDPESRALIEHADDEDDDDELNDMNDSDNQQGDVIPEGAINKAWKQLTEENNFPDILFGFSRRDDQKINLADAHPKFDHMMKLWQIYLENVDPLLKITHTPTLQARIIASIANPTNITPALEALMFSIYCIAVLSLTENECLAYFKSSQSDLLANYRWGCQEALINSGILRTNDRDCLTAFFIYLITVRPDVDHGSHCAMLSIAMRTAQRMGLHIEQTLAKFSPFEAEMRRRLWWAIVTFDNRMCEMFDYRIASLNSNWDCKPPLNVADSEMQPDMKALPTEHDRPTEALFAVVRSELNDVVRHAAFHQDFTNLTTMSTPRDSSWQSSELDVIESTLQLKYFRFCKPEIPRQFMAMHTIRSFVAKNRLLEHYSKFARSSTPQTDEQRDKAMAYAWTMLECDTLLYTAPQSKGFTWHVQHYFPFPAFVHIVKDMTQRPTATHLARSWSLINANCDARGVDLEGKNPFVKIMVKIIMQGWGACEPACRRIERPLEAPPIVRRMQTWLKNREPAAQRPTSSHMETTFCVNMPEHEMPLDMGGIVMPHDIGAQHFADLGPRSFQTPNQSPANFDMDNLGFDWTQMDFVSTFNPMQGRHW